MSERTEDQLRDAIRAYTETVDPSPGGWSRIEGRLESQLPRRRRPAVSLVGAVALVSALALAVVLVGQFRANPENAGVVPAGRPDQIVALTNDFELVILSAADGRKIRTLAQSAPLTKNSKTTRDPRTPTIAANNQSVFFDRGRSAREGECVDGVSRVDEIVRVSRDGRRLTHIGLGRHPAISPDGRFLAYIARPLGQCQGDRTVLVVRDLRSGLSRQWSTADGDALDESPSWAPDSRHLRFLVLEDVTPSGFGFSARLLDVDATTDIEAAQEVPYVSPPSSSLSPGSYIKGYLGTTTDLVGVMLPDLPPNKSTRVVAVDSATGEVRRTLFTLPARCCGLQVSSDASGRHLLAVGEGFRVYVWNEGDRKPSAIAKGVLDAAFVPEAPPTKLPSQIVSEIDGNLVVLDSEDGKVIRTLTGAGQPGSPTVSPDGDVYFSRFSSRCEIARVSITGGRPHPIASGLYAEVSPNGRWLAVVTDTNHSCEGGPDLIDVVDLRGEEPTRSIVARASAPRDPLSTGDYGFELIAWTADSRRVLLRTPAGYTYELDAFTEQAANAFNAGYPMTYLGSSARFVGAINLGADGGFQLLAFDADARVHRLARARRGSIVMLTADRSGRHLLYWVANQDGQSQTLWRRTLGDAPVRLRTERAHSSGGLPAVWVP